MFTRHCVTLTLLFVTVARASSAQTALPPAWDSVASILQTTAVPATGYQRFTLIRRDLSLRVGGLAVAPSLGVGAWVGFVGAPANATMMGDLVVIPSELKPVLAELARQNIDVTAIHNHLAGEEPSIRNIHFHAEGNATDLARRLDRAVALTGTPRPIPAGSPRPAAFDTAMVFRELGTSGRAQGDVASVTYMLIPVPVTTHGHTVDASLSLRSPVSVQMLDSSRAVATGDFAIVGSRLDALLDALATNGIAATAVHSHLVEESPTIYFIHFWADGPPTQVLRGLRAAADAGRARQ